METSDSSGSLKERLKSWRAELKGLGLAKDDRDELQSHMEDTLEELLAKRLTEDEAWIVAIHRVGETKDIRKEFQKMQEGRIAMFNHVLFWLLLFILSLQLVEIGGQVVVFLVQIGRIPGLSLACFTILLVVFGWILYRGKTVRAKTRWGIFNMIGPLIIMAFTFGMITKSDGPECHNSNDVFKNNSPKSDVYIRELVKLFGRTGTDNLYYRFGYSYSDKGRDYIVFNALGRGFCGHFSMDVTNSERMKQLVESKGMSYRGSVWKGLKFDLVADKAGTRFIFKSVEKIVD